MTPIKIPIQPIGLLNQKPTESSECYIELHEDHLEMKMVFVADEPNISNDHSSGYESVKNNFEIIVLRSQVAGIEKLFNQERNNWRVQIYINGLPEDIKIFTRTEPAALRYFTPIKNWILRC